MNPALIEETNMSIMKICKKHGELNIVDLIKSGKNKAGIQLYKCKLCMRELHKNHYAQNRLKVKAAHERYKESDPVKYRQIKNLSKRNKYAENPEKYRIARRERDNKNLHKKKERQKRYQRNIIDNLGDKYVKQHLCRNTNLKFKDIPLSLVELKRVLMLINRKKKELLNKNNKN